jgi:hypothetical protein
VSDHDHDHEHERGGHEIDKLPNARLFNLLFGLSALVLLSSIGVVQLFNLQVRSIEEKRAQQISFRLQEYRDATSTLLESHGTVTVVDEGGVERVAHHMPVADVRRGVLENPELLGAAPKYRGWETSSAGKTIATLQEANKAAMPPAMPTGDDDQPSGDDPEPADDEASADDEEASDEDDSDDDSADDDADESDDDAAEDDSDESDDED